MHAPLSSTKPKRHYPIVVPLPAAIYQMVEMIAAREGMTLTELGKQIAEHGRKHLPWTSHEEGETHNLTFHVTPEYYAELRQHAKDQGCFFKSLMLYWLISCVKDAEHVQGPDGCANSDQGVG